MSEYMPKYKNRYNDKYMDNPIENELHKKIMHDIRNMKFLTKEQMTIVRKMSEHEKMQIIEIFNDVMENITDIVNSL